MTQQQLTTLAEWAESENKRMEQEQQQAWDRNDYKPFLKLQVGETPVRFADAPPRTNAVMRGKRIFRVQFHGGEYDLAVKETSPLYRELAKSLAKGERALTIVRVGKGKADTKYSIKQQ